MASRINTISVTELKAKLSEQLRKVKAGETVLITERGRPIGMMNPLPTAIFDGDLTELAEGGLARLATAPLDPGFWRQDRAADPDGSVRAAIIEEREEGR